jgi:hypothetical protein
MAYPETRSMPLDWAIDHVRSCRRNADEFDAIINRQHDDEDRARDEQIFWDEVNGI